MSSLDDQNGSSNGHTEGASVLAKLPRTRPQRATARRTAARRTRLDAAAAPSKAQADAPSRAQADTAAPAPAARRRPAKAAKRAPAAPKAPRRTRSATGSPRLRAVPEEVPRQGFECEGERLTGSVQPPGGAELVGSVAELFSELAKAGIQTGERLLRDALSLLPRS